MTRTRSVVLSLALAAAFAAGAALPAHAGWGDAIKAAKDKATKAVTKKAGGEAATAAGGGGKVEFDDVLLELTDARLEQVITGFKAGAVEGKSRAALVAKHQKTVEASDALSAKYSSAIQDADSKRSEAESCWHEVIHKRTKAREDEMSQKMQSDPAMRAKMMDLAMQMGKAQAAGDNATVAKLQQQMMDMSGPTKADTAAAQAKCGALPPRHPKAAELEALQEQSHDEETDLRGLDNKMLMNQSKSSGLTMAQFAMARERIEMYLAGGKNPSGFTPNELSSLGSHRDALQAALAGS